MKKYLIYCVFTMMAFGCNNEKKLDDIAIGVTENTESSDTTYLEKIVKTADMRFRVKDVQNTKEKLSGHIQGEGGTVTEFSIRSSIQNSEKVGYSADSLLELTSYRTEGYLTAKIPSENLDAFTNKVAKLSVFIDQQSLKLDDKSLIYLTNQLKNRSRLEAVAQLGKHIDKKSSNIETYLYIKDDYVDKKVENLIIDNKTKYSNITLSFYQDNTVKRMIIENDNLSDFRPGFLRRFWLNIQSGWTLFTEVVLTLANLWVLILLVIVTCYIFRFYKKKVRSELLKSL